VDSQSFGVEVVNSNGRAIVSVRGEIDMSSGAVIRDALTRAQQGSPDVIVDLSDVTFMDSSGVNALLRAYYQAPPGGSLGVVGATSDIRRVFDITGLSELLLLDPPRPTWQQVTYNHSGWRQWITEETTDQGLPVAEIIEVGSRAGWAGDGVHYALESGGETTLHGSLDEAMQAVQLPGAVTPHTSEI
jgi:anti-anti-sigma factor